MVEDFEALAKLMEQKNFVKPVDIFDGPVIEKHDKSGCVIALCGVSRFDRIAETYRVEVDGEGAFVSTEGTVCLVKTAQGAKLWLNLPLKRV